MDLDARAQSRIAWQYRNSPKFRDWISVLPNLAQDEIEDVSQRIADLLDIDNTSGSLLDIVGRIVRQTREYREQLDNNTKRWGQAGIQFGASDSYFTATSETITQESEDALYRSLIKAKIERNVGDATIDGIVRSVSRFVSIESVDVIDYEDMSFDVVLFEEIPPEERFVLRNFDVVPRPQGVMFNGFVEAKVLSQWGKTGSMFRPASFDAVDQFGSTYYGAL